MVMGEGQYIRDVFIPMLKSKFELSCSLLEKVGDEISFLKRSYRLLEGGTSIMLGKYIQDMLEVFEAVRVFVKRSKVPCDASIQTADSSARLSAENSALYSSGGNGDLPGPWALPILFPSLVSLSLSFFLSFSLYVLFYKYTHIYLHIYYIFTFLAQVVSHLHFHRTKSNQELLLHHHGHPPSKSHRVIELINGVVFQRICIGFINGVVLLFTNFTTLMQEAISSVTLSILSFFAGDSLAFLVLCSSSPATLGLVGEERGSSSP